ncbi:MAG TPA: Rne/Rng family ribonuclease, partial [Terriglobales bacterium]|nr:Rne/Rng family ribonuclease [Terriglobales bacterium]
MSKELYVTSTPHETKLAVVEDDQLVEVFFERENEYTLAGSIYKGKVTRVLPGMQSAFVEIGLERDAFLYVTDFLEEVEDQDEVETTPAKQAGGEEGGERPERQERPERTERPQRNERPERGDRSGRGRNRRFNRSPHKQQQGAAPITGESFSIEHDATTAGSESFSTEEPVSLAPVDDGITIDSQSGAASNESTSSEDRGARRWRGRRGRRRGRGTVPESKFAASEGEYAAPLEAPVERVPVHDEDLAVDEEMEELSTQANDADKAPEQLPSEEPRPKFEQHRTAPVPREPRELERPRVERRPPPPMVLPGESLAKFNRKVEADAPKQSALPQQESRFQQAVPRPSTEVAAPSGFLSASHGLLAGETLAKYRNKPAAAEPSEKKPAVIEIPKTAPSETQLVTEDESVSEDQPASVPVQVQTAAPAEIEAVTEEVEQIEEVEETRSKEPSVESNARQTQRESSHDQAGRKGDYSFSPGSGVVEEEEIEDEEHEFTPFSEQLDDSEFEELEEETLEHKEDDVIAASEGLAEAFARSRVEDSSDTYMSEELQPSAGIESDEEESDDSDSVEEDVEGAEEDEAEVFADGSEGDEEEVLDPEDPNYAGRAETRAASGTASFQQRTDRGGPDRRRGGGGRNRKGSGRPPMRRGGPRRNIPRGPLPQINELLKEGQEILVQIAKEPMAKKGARITSHIALPGRFLVFMPTVNHTGVSRKIGSEEERQRLKRILISEKGQNHGGFIVRTAASGASEDDLRADIRFLINLWNEIKQRAETSKAPALIYHDLNLVERILRDQVTSTFTNIWVDTEQEYERILRFASRFQPSLVKRVKLYTKDTPLFEQFNIQEEINKGLKSKVWLKSGGYIVINQTEALVAIDINTGKYVGKTGRLEDTIVKTNIDAIKEIVRQIRLRDLGGIIIIDFIDMDERKNRQKVMQALEEALKSDRSPSKVLQFNDFGLVAITRKRVK